MRPLVWLLVVAGCTKPAAPAAAPPAAPSVVKQVASCEDAGPILRGPVGDEDGTGKTKEALITRLCVEQKWPRSVIECVAKSSKPDACLEELDPDLHGAYADAIEAWRDEHDDHGDDEEHVDADAERYVSCEDAINGVPAWSTAVTAGEEGEAARRMRVDALTLRCDEDGWSSQVKACLQNEGAIGSCLALSPRTVDTKAIDATLAEVDRVIAGIATTKAKKPATYACKAVVATHYGDDAWKGKLPELKGAERTRVIKASRTKMLDACTNNQWTATARACVVAKGGDRCFLLTPGTPRWGFPAPGVLAPLGVASCDAYAAAIIKLSTCDKLPKETRDALVQSLQQTQEAWQAVPPEGRGALEEACKSAKEAVDQAGASCN